jgi:hypothetical protein
MAYVGNETDHLSVLIDMNPPYASKLPVNGKIGDIYDDQSWATASYNSLQVSLDQHVWHGLQVQSSFAWSHTIDITGTSNVSYGNPALGNPISAKWNRGNSGADLPWAWISNFIYQAPSFREKGKLMEETVGGWQLSSIITWQKGSPFSIGQWGTDPGVGMWNNRADSAPGVPNNMGNGSHWDWVNPAKGYFNWDAFNATNHPNFSGPSSTVNQSAGTFGVISGTNGNPRVFQGALRLTF